MFRFIFVARMAPSSGGSRRSSISLNGGNETPISFQSGSHQIAFYATFTSDVTPRSFDPPIPWEVSFPGYHAIRWTPPKSAIPSWQPMGASPWHLLSTKAKVVARLRSIDSTAQTVIASGPEAVHRNPEGRVGTAGKGLRPRFGANSACVVVITRGVAMDEVLTLKGVRPQVQLPWVRLTLVTPTFFSF